MPAIRSCLWFATDAEPAAEFYVSLFPDSRVGNVMRAGAAVVAVDFVLDGQPFTAINGRRDGGFTDAVSFMIPCATQADVDRYWDALTRDGGEEGQCGWLKDRFGVSWQVVPDELPGLLGDPDRARANRAMQAMFGMRKLDVAALRAAADAEPATA
jgi:predicted 3-demethylubiquinone-9 3-methyltransferase (glyoxalase superfamily)